MWIAGVIVACVALWYLQKAFAKKSTSTRVEVPPIAPAAPEPEDKDSWEGAFYDVEAQRSASKTVRIQYEDGNGRRSERDITVRAFEPSRPEGLVIAHCHMRNATRTFRFDRMKRVVDMETGEIIANLQQQLNDEWQASPEPVLDKLYREHNEVLKLMLYMAKADGSVRAAEVGVITKYCQDITQDDRITPDLVKDLLKAVDVVGTTTFSRTYNKLRREQPEVAAQAASACRAIVATQKTVHPNEQAALEILDKPLPRKLEETHADRD